MWGRSGRRRGIAAWGGVAALVGSAALLGACGARSSTAIKPVPGSTTTTATTVPGSTTSTTAGVLVGGKYRFAPPIAVPIANKAAVAAVGALRKKGLPDIVTGNADGTVSVLLNQGKGVFAKPVVYAANPAFRVMGVSVNDVNGDGNLDVIAGAPDPTGATTISVLLGRGDGRLGKPIVSASTIVTGYPDTPLSLAVGDFIGDRRLDVAVGFTPGGANAAVVRLYPGLGNGRFGPAATTLGVANTYGAVASMVPSPLGRQLPGLVAVNAGCGYNSGGVVVFAKKGGTLVGTSSGFVCPVNVAAGDVNGDGWSDLVTTTGRVLQNGREGAVWFGKADGTFGKVAKVNLGAEPAFATLADLRGNGKLDFVATLPGGIISIAAGNGDGTFQPPVTVANVGNTGTMIVADLTGQGTADVIFVASDISILVNQLRPPHGTLSTIASSLASPREAFHNVKAVAVGGTIAIGGVLFITFPAELFNQTFEQNYEVIDDWWKRRFGWVTRLRDRVVKRRAADDPRTRQRRDFIAVLLLSGLLGGLLDPHFGFNASSAESYVAVTIAVLVGVVVHALVTTAYHRVRFQAADWHLHALPMGLAIAAGGVIVSRLTSFQPGYLYGIVCGVAFTRKLAKAEDGQVVALTTAATLVVAVAAWFAWLPLHKGAARPGAFFGEVILVDLLASMFVGGLVGSALSMFPLRFLAGSKLRAWRNDAWAALFLTALFGVVQVLLRSHSKTAPHTDAPFATTLALFIAFAAVSVAFRQYFSTRARRLEKAEPMAAI